MTPRRPCLRCGRISTQSYCPDHRRPAWRHSVRKSAAERGYDHAWTKTRNQHITQYPHCVLCGETATNVDHIIPLAHGGSRLDHANLQSLCTPCKKLKDAHDSQQGHRRNRRTA